MLNCMGVWRFYALWWRLISRYCNGGTKTQSLCRSWAAGTLRWVKHIHSGLLNRIERRAPG
jgi:hypothetical protein